MTGIPGIVWQVSQVMPNLARAIPGEKTNIPCGVWRGSVAYAFPSKSSIPLLSRLSGQVTQCGGTWYVLAHPFEQVHRLVLRGMVGADEVEEWTQKAANALNPQKSILPWIIGGLALLYVLPPLWRRT